MAEVKVNMNPAHTHSYTKHIKYRAIKDKGLNIEACAEGHADCRFPQDPDDDTWGYDIPEANSSEGATTGTATRDNEIRINNHVHTYEDSLGHANGIPSIRKGGNCASGHSACIKSGITDVGNFSNRNSSLPTTYGNDIRIAMLHKHTHCRLENTHIKPDILVSLATCPLGHTRCQGILITSLEDFPAPTTNYLSGETRA